MELDQLTVLLILSDPNFYEWMAGYIAQQSGLQVTAEQCLQYVQLAAQSGDQLAQQLIMQYILAYTLVRSAAAGTKLDYISRLRGKCPAGYQMLYYKQGGRVCKKCVKKKAAGGVMSNDFTVGATGENAVNAFKRAYSYRQGGAVTKYEWPAGPIDIIKGIGKILLPDEVRKAINKAIGRDNSGNGNKSKEPDVIYVPEPYPVEPPRPTKAELASSVETDYVTVELPWLDQITMEYPAISGNSLAKRVITNYPYLPADTAITVSGIDPYGWGHRLDLTFYNYDVDGRRRAFDYLNGLFPENLPDTVFVEKPVIKYKPRPVVKPDTLNVKLIGGDRVINGGL